MDREEARKKLVKHGVLPESFPEVQYRMDWDDWSQDGYFYTEYDIGGEGHGVTIKAEDKEKFLDAFAKECRDRAEKLLKIREENV